MNTMRLAAALALAAVLAGCDGRPAERAEAPDQTRDADAESLAADTAHSGMGMSGDMMRDMPMMNERMTAALGPADSTYDLRWIDMMIQHHRGAVMMAQDAASKTQRGELRQMARKIIADQEAEIRRMEEMRRQWYQR